MRLIGHAMGRPMERLAGRLVARPIGMYHNKTMSWDDLWESP